MPVFVGTFLNEMRSLLRTRLGVTPVSELSAVRPQSSSKGALVCREIFWRIAVADAKLLDRLARAHLSDTARLLNGLFKILAEIA